MIRGNTDDFIDHPYLNTLYLHMGPPITTGPQAPHHLNPALIRFVRQAKCFYYHCLTKKAR